MIRLAAIQALALLAGGCVAPVADGAGVYARPIGDAPVIDNDTAYSRSLTCLRGAIARADRPAPRIAVGEIRDYTGKIDEDSGAKITQGAALMAISALARLGLPQVERLDMRVAEAELRLANNNLIGADGGVRPILAGSMPWSDLHLVGGVTELNYNIGSSALDVFYSRGGVGAQLYVLNIAVDLRLVRTQTLEVADVVSYQKQIIGREIGAGVFEFFDGNLFDLSASSRALEPMQLAVRAMIERAVGEMARRLFELPAATCAPEEGDGA